MRLPAENAAHPHRVRYGRYVTRRLRREDLNTLAQSAESATQEVKQKGRAWEDAEEPLQDALADRDSGDARLDNLAQTIRLRLASRSLNAIRVSPYTDIFPEGIEYYTAAPLPENAKRYGELVTRLEKFLPPEDELRGEVPKIVSAIQEFENASKAVEKARTELAIAASDLSSAEDHWRAQMEKLYGALIERFDKVKAERFFPSARGGRVEESTKKPAP